MDPTPCRELNCLEQELLENQGAHGGGIPGNSPGIVTKLRVTIGEWQVWEGTYGRDRERCLVFKFPEGHPLHNLKAMFICHSILMPEDGYKPLYFCVFGTDESFGKRYELGWASGLSRVAIHCIPLPVIKECYRYFHESHPERSNKPTRTRKRSVVAAGR